MTMDWTGPRRALRRVAAWLTLGAAVGLLAACGGGSRPIEAFAPLRMFALGDEISVLTNVDPKGRKYTVNGLDANGQVSCALNVGTTASLLWTQQMALAYAFVFEECNPFNLEPTAWTFAAPGAKAADFATQYAAAEARFGPLGPRDVMTVLFGANDVLEVVPRYLADPSTDNFNAIMAELRQRGADLANKLNAIMVNCGPKFIVSTMPLMGLTPYALQLQRDNPTLPVFNTLQQFSNNFNSGLRTTMINDGSLWGLVELDALLSAGTQNPGNYGLVNITQAACAVSPTTNCTSAPADLVAGASPATWLWASDRWMGWRAHQYLGGFAAGRVTDNPFPNGCPSTY